MPHHLLLADDSVTIQRVIKLTFADEDVDVVTVGDGDQAVAAIDKAPPDIVLADVAMPGRTGYDVAQHIRQTPRLAHIPVVLLTGAFEPVDEARASKVGCDAVLAKPFEPEVVVTRVRELLARPRPHAAPAAEPSVAPTVTPPAMPVAPVPAVAVPSPLEAAPAPPAAVAAVPRAWAGIPAPAVDPIPLALTSTPPAPAAGSVAPAIPPASTEEPLPTPASSLPGLSGLAGTRPTPAPAKRSPAEVDAYFDRLDEAFASLATAPRSAPVPVPEPRAVPPLSLVPPAAPRPPAPSVGPAPAASLAAAFEGLLAPNAASSESVDPPPTAPAVEHLAVPPTLPGDATTAVTIATAPAATTTAPAATTTGEPRGGGLTDAQVAELADRVLAQLTARLGAKTLPEIVAQVAERLVRAEIDQIKQRV